MCRTEFKNVRFNEMFRFQNRVFLYLCCSRQENQNVDYSFSIMLCNDIIENRTIYRILIIIPYQNSQLRNLIQYYEYQNKKSVKATPRKIKIQKGHILLCAMVTIVCLKLNVLLPPFYIFGTWIRSYSNPLCQLYFMSQDINKKIDYTNFLSHYVIFFF